MPPLDVELRWIDQPDDLQRYAGIILREPQLAIDTESNSLYAYQERVCLIQASAPHADYLVDPLAIDDLSPLAPIFSSPEIEKIFHGAEYDLACLKRDFGFQVVNLFDTRIALRTLGMQPNGLADVLAQEFGIQLDKRYQRADWGKRPLSAAQLDYARLDTHYLLPLRQRLAQALQDAGRWEEAKEACTHLACSVHSGANGHSADFWSVSNSRKLEPRQAAVLRELFAWRDHTAQQLDRPPFKVMSDETIMELARLLPQDEDALLEIPGLTPRVVQRSGSALLAAIERGRHAAIPRPPSAEPADPAILARYDQLRRWRKRLAAERGVESDIILPREVLWAAARAAPRDLASLQPLMECLPWRFRTYGPAVLQALWG